MRVGLSVQKMPRYQPPFFYDRISHVFLSTIFLQQYVRQYEQRQQRRAFSNRLQLVLIDGNL